MSVVLHGPPNVSRLRRRRAIASLVACVPGLCLAASEAEQTRTTNILETILVTAQKRSEDLLNVPISMSVMNGTDLDKFTGEGVSEALTLVPGIKLTTDARVGGVQLGLRGVAAAGPYINGSSPVAYYIDSVPFGLVKTAVVPDSNPYDLERVEVLRGPQGTLYGASALNGVVRVLTHPVDLNKFDLKARASVSDVEEGGESYRGDMAINVPLIEGRLGARATVGYAKLDGWIDTPVKEDTNDAELSNFRLKVKAQPTDELSIGVGAWLSRSDYGAPNVSDDDDFFPGTADQPTASDFDVFDLTVGYEFEHVSLTSTTSYLDYSNYSKSDFSMFFADVFGNNLDSEVFAEELLLSSKSDGPWRWSLGGYYRDAEDRLRQEWIFLPAPIDFADTSTSFALFGELTRVMLDGKLELTGGLRYFEDDVEQIENKPFDGDTARPLVRRQDTFDALSPRVVLTWHPSARATLYTSYSEGFRSGYNQSAFGAVLVPDAPTVKEDTLKNYEVGVKGNVLGGHLTYDAAAYYIDWQDVQQTLAVGVSAIVVAVNGKAASGPGIDLALVAHPVDSVALGVSFSWNDLTLDEQVITQGVVMFDKGDRLNYSAEYTAGASLSVMFPFGALEGRVSAQANYSSEQATRTLAGGMVFEEEGDETTVARVSAAIGAPDRWTVSLFADNVTNESASPVRNSGAPFFSTRLRPRTIGLQLEYSF